jgi:enoyl-CoA hydratase/carnithine racemase
LSLATRSIGRVRVLELDRPERLNAFDRDLYAASAAALAAAADDDAIHVVVLTGRGRAFCAGVDLAELEASAQGRATPGFTEAAADFVDQLRSYEKPLLVAVNGLAVGIGTTLLTYADLVFAAESARFQTPFSKLGVAPEIGSSWRLPRLIGWQDAAWMLLSSDWIDAPRAQAMGLVFRCVADASLLDVTLEAAGQIAEHRLDSLRAIKRTLQAWREAPSLEAERREGREFQALLGAGWKRP